jgi:hypothetical protein
MNIDAKLLNKIIANQIINMSENLFTMTKSASSIDARMYQHMQINKCKTVH